MHKTHELNAEAYQFIDELINEIQKAGPPQASGDRGQLERKLQDYILLQLRKLQLGWD